MGWRKNKKKTLYIYIHVWNHTGFYGEAAWKAARILKLPPLHNRKYHGNQWGTGRQERKSAEKWLSMKRSQAGTLLPSWLREAYVPKHQCCCWWELGSRRDSFPLLSQPGVTLSWWRPVDDSKKRDGWKLLHHVSCGMGVMETLSA